MNFRLFIERYGGATNKIMYHGTTDGVLKNIMSVGLIPNAKKSWNNDPGNFDTPSRDSLGGIYVTDNLMTAMSAARNTVQSLGGQNRILVIMSLQPRSFLADEDSISFFTQRLWHPKYNPNSWLTKELYNSWLKDPNSEMVQEFRQHYVESIFESLEYKLGKLHPELEKRLKILLEEGFTIALKRKAAYADYDSWGDSGPKIDLDKNQVEREYSQYMDQLTRTLRSLLAQPDKSNSINFTARLEQPVRFSGKNKIICIVKITRDETRRDNVSVVYGELPDKFKADWTERIGELNVI